MNEDKNTHLPLIGETAPAFRAMTTMGKVNFPADYKGRWVILFSHPADFTPVCTTEFITFAKMQEEFDALNTDLIGLSIDSLHSHLAWAKSIESIDWNNNGKVKIKFPIIADINMDVSKKYGMLHAVANTQTVRAVFIIDPDSVIRSILYYPMSTGRNFDEIKRLILALQKHEQENVSTPADWRPGDDLLASAPLTLEEADARMNNPDDDTTPLEWYLSVKKDK